MYKALFCLEHLACLCFTTQFIVLPLEKYFICVSIWQRQITAANAKNFYHSLMSFTVYL